MSDLSFRACSQSETRAILDVVNRAAERYRGVIPADCWHEPYMTEPELVSEFAAGVKFTGALWDGEFVGVMGMQPVEDVFLIRHAYVLPSHQGRGIGGALLEKLSGTCKGPVLVGTWAAAAWAINFYEHHGFRLVPAPQTPAILRRYWDISERQIQVSVALMSESQLTPRGIRPVLM
jgi:GNAT superfamily N-acetyltransferase